MLDHEFISICNILYVNKSRGCLPIIADLTNKGSILSRDKIQIYDLTYMIQFLCGPCRLHISRFFVCRYPIDLFSRILYKFLRSLSVQFISENRKPKMKLKFLPILAGTTSGWSLPPTNYTNPCEDFHVSRSSLFKGKTLR